MSIALGVLFLITALLYASVGFGGGSTYNALLVLAGADYRLLPSIALVCNIIVVAGGTWRFSNAGHLRLKRLAPFVIASVPAAFIGGRIPVSETDFIGLLGLSLLLAGLRLAFDRSPPLENVAGKRVNLALSVSVGGGIGLLSGLVGIGGGIFLAPILYLLRWGNAREIAGTCSLFILVNSLSGLAGQLLKLGDLNLLAGFAAYWPLFPAVFVGGQIGSRLGSVGLKSSMIQRLTAVLVLYVAARLLMRWLTLVA